MNCAAYTAVDKAEENEEFCNLLNNIAPGYLAKAIEKRGGYMVQVSTDYVFDGTNHTPYTEEILPLGFFPAPNRKEGLWLSAQGNFLVHGSAAERMGNKENWLRDFKEHV